MVIEFKTGIRLNPLVKIIKFKTRTGSKWSSIMNATTIAFSTKILKEQMNSTKKIKADRETK